MTTTTNSEQVGELSVWRIQTSEVFWVVAFSCHDALQVLLDANMADDYANVADFVRYESPRVKRLDGGHMLAIEDEELGGKLSKSCRCWAEDEGRGYLAGTCW